MYWLMKQLRPLNCQTTIYLVKLPTWEYGKENTMTSKISWGEVSPSEWGNYITLQEKAEPVFLSACANPIEQIIWMDKDKFEKHLKEEEAIRTEEQKATLSYLGHLCNI